MAAFPGMLLPPDTGGGTMRGRLNHKPATRAGFMTKGTPRTPREGQGADGWGRWGSYPHAQVPTLYQPPLEVLPVLADDRSDCFGLDVGDRHHNTHLVAPCRERSVVGGEGPRGESAVCSYRVRRSGVATGPRDPNAELCTIRQICLAPDDWLPISHVDVSLQLHRARQRHCRPWRRRHARLLLDLKHELIQPLKLGCNALCLNYNGQRLFGLALPDEQLRVSRVSRSAYAVQFSRDRSQLLRGLVGLVTAFGIAGEAEVTRSLKQNTLLVALADRRRSVPLVESCLDPRWWSISDAACRSGRHNLGWRSAGAPKDGGDHKQQRPEAGMGARNRSHGAVQ